MKLLKFLFGTKKTRRNGSRNKKKIVFWNFSLKPLFGSRQTKRRSASYKKGTVDFNAYRMRKKYPLTKGGYFGTKGNNRRVIYSENQYKESKRFFSKIGKGGVETPLSNKHGVQKIMKDGGRVVYRGKTSTKESPAVDLGRMQGRIKNQRIHFERRKK